MAKVMFYCQHILGIGHLIRSMEIVKGLLDHFEVCFINGGQIVEDFPVPTGIKLVNLPAIKTDAEFQQLQSVDPHLTIEAIKEIRTQKLLETVRDFQPDILLIELFPFGRKKFSFELIPLIETAKLQGAKVVCSLRDIVVTKTNQAKHEAKICRLINQYFDLVLVHGDPNFVSLDETFGRIEDLNCPVYYTGYVAQSLPPLTLLPVTGPLILVSVGGGRFGHDLLETVVKAAPILQTKIPHHIQIFTGPFAPQSVLDDLRQLAADSDNVSIERYTPHLLNWMQQAELSISMSGYNTTLNVLKTGVRAMIKAFTGNDDQEQTIRSQRLESLNRVKIIHPEDLQPEILADHITSYLQQQPSTINFDFNGVTNTSIYLRQLIHHPVTTV